MSDIKGIPQEKLDRLWMHLEKVEKFFGKKLKKTPRREDTRCPIKNFSPNDTFIFFVSEGIYEVEDSEWWKRLPDETRIQITKWIMKRVKERASTV